MDYGKTCCDTCCLRVDAVDFIRPPRSHSSSMPRGFNNELSPFLQREILRYFTVFTIRFVGSDKA